MTYQKPFLSKQTVVPSGNMVQLNTYGGYTRGWIVNTVFPQQRNVGLKAQLLRLVELSEEFRSTVSLVYQNKIGQPLTHDIWESLSLDTQYDLCILAQKELSEEP